MFIPISYFIWVAKIADHYNAQARNKQTRYKSAIAWLIVGFIIVSAFMELIPVLAPALAMIFPFLGGALAVAALILIVVMASLLALLFIAIVVISYICFYYIFASCVPDHKVLFLLLSIFTCMPGLFVFIVRKSDKGMPAQEAVPAADTAAEESVLAPVQ